MEFRSAISNGIHTRTVYPTTPPLVYPIYMDIPREELAHLIQDKYHGDKTADLTEDIARLAAGEPLAYVIGWIPFLSLDIFLDSHPLIPRPETEWWTEQLIQHVNARFANIPFTLLDVCAGSGAVGLAVLKHCPQATVSFGELSAEHSALIEKNIVANNLDASRATVRTGDLFAPYMRHQFEIIAANPPYIPESREVPDSVSEYEPQTALYAGEDGLDLIRRIANHAPHHVTPGGELWMECDTTHTDDAKALLTAGGAPKAIIRNDLYGRPRLVIAYY